MNKKQKQSVGIAVALGLIYIAGSLWVIGKRSTKPHTYPRPYGFARIHEYPADYSAVEIPLPFRIELNSKSTFEFKPADNRATDRNSWLTVTYPDYGATINYTFTQVADSKRLEAVGSNRANRFERNLAGANGNVRMTDTESAGGAFTGYVISSDGSSVTPVQFMVSDGREWIVSGTASFMQPSSVYRADSLTPAINIIERDIIHTLQTLDAE